MTFTEPPAWHQHAECARNLFDSPMPDANQLDLFGGVA